MRLCKSDVSRVTNLIDKNEYKRRQAAVGVRITQRGLGRQKGHTELYSGAKYVVDFLPKIKIELASTYEMVKAAMEAIIKAGILTKLTMVRFL